MTSHQLQCGQGLGYQPGSVDISGSSYDRIDHHREKILQDTCVLSTVVGEMEKIVEKLDCKDAANGGLSALSEAYKKLGRPYMRDYAISSSITYQFIMSPLMCKLLAETDFLETDMTYNENTVLTYLFNATVFDYTTIKWQLWPA